MTPIDTATSTAGTAIAVGSVPGGVAVTPDQGPAARFSAAAASTGQASSFDASASSDPDGTVSSYHWDFGDGASQTTTSATTTHTYATANAYTVRLTVTDDAGCSTALVFTGQTAYCNATAAARTSRSITVPPPAVIVPPPTISNLRVSPHELSVAGRKVNGKCVKPTHKNNSTRRCLRAIKLKVSYTLNRAATVTFTLKRMAPGRKANAKCVKPTKQNKHKQKCPRLIGVHGQLDKTGHAGADSFTFDGKLSGHRLARGSYQLTATPTAGKPHTTTFTIAG